ncbi:MAG: TlpA disulfide reductase family protein, partial [Acidobacteria bacterium]|nr:TlpA disulfide reductase family protein [Acidobacteriota bacterium]
ARKHVPARPRPAPSPSEAAVAEWNKAHPMPKPEDPRLEAYVRDRYRAGAEWIRQWPDDVRLHVDQVWAARMLDGMDVEAIADGFLAALSRDPDALQATPYRLDAAGLYAERGIRLSRVPALVEEAFQEMELDRFSEHSDLEPFRPRDETAYRHGILARARRLWSGTEEGWKAWLEAPSTAREEDLRCVSVRGEWKPSGKPLPEFAVSDQHGRKWTQADFKGRTTFVNIWATWCAPCREELPEVEKLYQRLKGRADVAVVTLSIDESPGVVAPFVESHRFTFPVLHGKSLYDSVVPDSSIPRNWIINRAGAIEKEQIGFDKNGRWLDEMLAELEKAK